MAVEQDLFDFIDRCPDYRSTRPMLADLTQNVRKLGFEHFIFSGIPLPGDALEPLVELNGWPQGWFERYVGGNYAEFDGVCRYSRETVRPFFWNEVPEPYFRTAQASRVVNEATDFGLRSGYIVPAYSRRHWHALMSAEKGRAEISETSITFSHALIAAGATSFPILQSLMPPMPKPLGQGVKGQAALMKADLDPMLPVVFLDGVYVVPHEGGLAAIGSTSENHFRDPLSTDHQLDAVIEKARALIPALRDAEVVERWAGIRPKAIGRDPLVGPVPGHANVIALTGGFKISLGMAHRLADSALDHILGRSTAPLPENFTLSGQLTREMSSAP